MAAVRAALGDGRLHLQHGPIDLVIGAQGDAAEVRAAYDQAWDRFQDILDALVAELPLLRSPMGGAHPLARGPVARRMVAAVWPLRAVFITPMAAVAGAVADEILAALLANRRLSKAYVNNGGDIAVFVAPGETFTTGIVDNASSPGIDAMFGISAPCGVATSGWRGRSHSLGIADAVTVLARSAAKADAAATLVANGVQAEHPAIRRAPARTLREDSDLGDLPVTTAVGPLPPALVDAALDCGVSVAAGLKARGLLQSAYLALQGRRRALPTGLSKRGALPCPQPDAMP